MGLKLQIVGESTLCMIIFGLTYFILELCGFPRLYLESYSTEEIVFINDLEVHYITKWIDLHLVFLFLFGIWCAFFITIMIIHKIKGEKIW